MSLCGTDGQFGSSFRGNYKKIFTCSEEDLERMEDSVNEFLNKNQNIDIVFTVVGRVPTATGNYKAIIFYNGEEKRE